jgi:hypothetical protein
MALSEDENEGENEDFVKIIHLLLQLLLNLRSVNVSQIMSTPPFFQGLRFKRSDFTAMIEEFDDYLLRLLCKDRGALKECINSHFDEYEEKRITSKLSLNTFPLFS